MSDENPASKLGHPPKGHQWVPTEDGSLTLYSEQFDENCHSTAGARNETQTHYLEGCEVEQLLSLHQTVHVLEVGFATGLGWEMTKALAFEYPHSTLHFVSLELDEDLIQWVLPHAVKKVSKGVVWYELTEQNAKLTVIAGDARSSLPCWIQQFPERFHAIYQDAFSPKKNPTLWTVEWFTLLGQLALPGCIMSTYSSSVSIRKSMVEAGWGVRGGKNFGPKKSSTRAHWQKPSDDEIIELLKRSPTQSLKDQS